MKDTCRFRGNSETLHSGNFSGFRNKEELLETLGFCEPAFKTIECSHSDEKEEIAEHSVGSQYLHHASGLSKRMPQEIPLPHEVR